MSTRTFCLAASTPIYLVLLSWSHGANGQPAPQEQAAPPAATAKGGAGAEAAAAGDAAKKQEILNSDHWRRAMFELDEWLRTQNIHTPQEVVQLRSEFEARVEKMSAKELQDMLADMDAKFRILDTAEAREARQWLGQYLSLLADWRREEILSDIPAITKMTPAQLNELIARYQRRRASRNASNRNRQMRVEAQLQANQQSRQAFTQNRASRGSGYRSPYRPRDTERPFGDSPSDSGRRRTTIDPYGQVWLNL